MLALIDKLMIAFIYTNIVFPQIEIFSVAISRVPIAAALVCFGAYVVVNRARIPRGTLAYVHGCLALLVVLAAISVVAKGNPFGNAVQFVAPVVMRSPFRCCSVCSTSTGSTGTCGTYCWRVSWSRSTCWGFSSCGTSSTRKSSSS
jgi:hypothetical protein